MASKCLETDNSSKIVKSRALVTKAADAITILGELNIMLTSEKKTRFKPALSESYQSLCDHDFSQSVYLLANDSPEELRKAKSRHFLEATNSKRQRKQLRKSIKKIPITSGEYLNYQGRKKYYSGPQH